MVQVREVRSARDIREFIEFPLRLYKDCRWFVPPLYGDEKKLLRSGGSSEIAESIFFLAERDGKTVGRIHALIQKQYNENHNCRKMRFTRFDSLDDPEIPAALFAAAEQWGVQRGMDEICGPLGFNDLDREGLLIDGFEEESTFEEQYNYPYYGELLEGVGFRKDVDWLEFQLTKPEKYNEMLSRVAKRALEMHKLHIGDFKMSKREYIEKYRDGFFNCLDECYSKLYGTVPISPEAQDELVSQFMMILSPEHLVFICDENDQVVAFGLCFPGIGEAVKKSGGRLTLSALVKILRTVKHPKTVDLGLVAVRPEYQNAGVNAVIVAWLQDALWSGQVERFETNLCLETNKAVQAQWKFFSVRQNKRRRAYIKKIGE